MLSKNISDHQKHPEWLGKPYYSLDAYCKHTFGRKCYKVALNAGMTCPNRDGTLDTRGCIFCSAGGSGDFSIPVSDSTDSDLQKGLALLSGKKTGESRIAYFQAYTNTYAPLPYLETVYRKALSCRDIIGISIGTRPDCINAEIIALLVRLKEEYHKFIWIELGLQTIHEKTAVLIRRGYPLPVFTRAVRELHTAGIPVITHLILGLPGETEQMMYESVTFLNTLPIQGVKLQLLHVLSGTDLGTLYENSRGTAFSVLTMDGYLRILIRCLELLSPETVIHRLTGDGPKDLLLAPRWSLDKRAVLNTLHKKMKEQNTYQGRCYYDPGSSDSL